MLKTEKERADFREEFNITSEKFRDSGLTWDELEQIAEHFEPRRNGHLDTVKLYANVLQTCPGVHSLSYRVKKTGHLLEKIIRKNPEYMAEGDCLSVTNYEQKITDLMGIRLLILFKEDWIGIHEKIMKNYNDILWEPPFVYVRKGDDVSLYEGKIRIREDKPYRSAHYVIRSETGHGIEIQVRTLYEEAWSEIDHRIRYPYDLTNEMINNYLNMLNRLTGMGDEMGTFVNKYRELFHRTLHSGDSGDDREMREMSELLKRYFGKI